MAQNSNFEIHRMLVVSTAHCTEEEAERFTSFYELGSDENHQWMASFVRDEGWIVYTDQYFRRDHGFDGLSDGLRGILEIAYEQGVDWVMFDRDADLILGVPFYEW
jgi:hypothetical protein